MAPRDADAAYEALCDRGGLTRRQLAIWAGDRMAAGRPVFVEAGMMRLRGALDVERFQRAFQAVVDECDALRIAIDDDQGSPCQRFRAAAVGAVDLVETASTSMDGIEALAAERAARVGVEGALYDSALVRVAADDHVWLLAQHQLISDAWSFGVLFDRTALHYERLAAGDGPVPAAPPAFREYVEWERRYRGSARCAAARKRWESRFADAHRVAGFRPGVGHAATTATRRVCRPLGAALSTALRALAAEEAATEDVGIFAVAAAAVAAEVARSTRVAAVVLNVPFANRPSGRFKRTAGSFMNVWPVRLAVEPDDTFRGIVARAVAEAWETAAHQEYVGRPGPVPQPFDVFLNVHKQAVAARTFAGLAMEVRWLAPAHRFGGLAVALEDFGATRELTVVVDCNTAVFGAADHVALADDLVALLAAGVAEPDRRVAMLPRAGASSVVCARMPVVEASDQAPALRALWCQLLDVAAVGLDDDFFALGGDSLLAYRMLVRARDALGLEATVEAFLERPTIAGVLAVAARRAPRDGEGHPRPASGRATPIAAVPRGEGVRSFPASLAQERLWVLERTAGPEALANVAGAFRAVGRLDLARLRHAFEGVVARHESLRTTFALVGDAVTQIVSPHAVARVTVVDVGAAGSREEREAAAERLVTRAVDCPFDTARGPLLRITVVRVDDHLAIVGVALHHLIADAWSMTVFVREVVACYREEALPRPALQYPDFASWQRQERDPASTARRVAYWRAKLADLPAAPRATRGAPRPGCRVTSRRIGDDVLVAVRALTRRTGSTLFAAVLTAWQAVLARFAGVDDVVVLVPVDERDRPELAEVIGFFVDLVPVRVRVDAEAPFAEALARTTIAVREALRSKLPFQTLLDAVGGERGLAPLTPFAFALERAAAERIDLPAVEIRALTLARSTSRAALALIAAEETDGLTVRVEYDGASYEAGTAEALLDDVIAGLARVATESGRSLGSTVPAVVTPGRSLTGPASASVWDAVAMQAARTPNAVALRSGPETVTYAALVRRAEGVSDTLRRHRVAAGDIVAVWGERGPHLAAALLGVLRANAVYLPLDPRWPEARIAQVLEASRTRVVLSGDASAPALERCRRGGVAWQPVTVGAGPGSDVAPYVAAAGDDAAYVLYTSGSTGSPKGAVIEHAGMLNHLRSKVAVLGLTAADRVAQTAAAGFDVSLWQYLAPWLVGAEVVVLDDVTVRDPERLRNAVTDAAVTVLEVVPAVAQLLLDAEVSAGARGLGSLRWLVVTGEALPPAFCRAWLARHPEVPIVNAYGPTECADDVTHHVVRTPPPPEATRVPIGTPIDGVTVHVLDAALRPVPVGEVGELCVGGVAVGRGYLHDAVRTAAAFVTPDPIVGAPGPRLYRTGDLGRRLADGTFECLGRRDRQLKIRGVRVELEEIEIVVQRHPAVRQAAVVARPATGGGWKLVACVATSAPSAGLAEGLRRHVAEYLPEAMVPAAFETFAALPLGPNGKIDRVALARPAHARHAAPLVGGPESACERLLAAAWRDVLGVEVRCVDDDFFALGGDSLSSIRVVAAMRRQGFVVTPQQIFEHRTIARIAAVAVSGGADDAEQGLVVGDVEPTPVQRAFLEAELRGLDHYNLSMLLEVDEPVSESRLAVAVEHVMRHHDMLRMRWSRTERGWRQTIAGVDGAIPCRRVDLVAVGDDEVSSAIERAADAEQGTLDLATGPVLRVVWFDLGPSRPGRLLLIVHHLACDVASMAILLEDLAALCGRLARGEAIALPPKTTSYQAWAEGLAAWGGSDARVAELAHWVRECRDGGARLPGGDMQPASTEPATSIAATARRSVTLDPSRTAAVQEAAITASTTVEAVLLTALALAMTDVAGGDGVLVWLERHGREPIVPGCDVSRTVGWFTSIFPVRVPIAPSRLPHECLALAVRHLRAIPDGGIGYGVLRHRAAVDGAPTDPARILRTLARPEVSFNYLGRLDPPETAGWRVAGESPGGEVGVHGVRPTRLDVTAHLLGGRLHLEWSWDRGRCGETLIARLADRMLDVVDALTTRATVEAPGPVAHARGPR